MSRGYLRWFLAFCLLLGAARPIGKAFGADPYLPGEHACSTWKECIADHLYVTEKWWEATFSVYETCWPILGNTFLGKYPRPSDGLYCYYYNIYVVARSETWMMVNAALQLGGIDCQWLTNLRTSLELGITCDSLQRDFGAFTGR